MLSLKSQKLIMFFIEQDLGLERDPEDLVSITIEGKFIGRVHRSSRFFVSFKLIDSEGADHSHLIPVAEKLTENLRIRRSDESLEGELLFLIFKFMILNTQSIRVTCFCKFWAWIFMFDF